MQRLHFWRLFMSRNQSPKKRTNGSRYSSSEDQVLEPLGTMLYAIWAIPLRWSCLLSVLT